jgi:cytochrome c oxidase subunit 2
LVVPKGATVDLKIRSRDVLHSVYLPHFRVKMDAVPGMDTRFHFVPTKTTAEFRKLLYANEYWGQVDTIETRKVAVGDKLKDGSIATVEMSVTDTIRKADKFDFELACAEVCGRGHYSMRKVVVVMEPEEYKAWKARASQANLASVIKPAEGSQDHNDMAELNKGQADKKTSILE